MSIVVPLGLISTFQSSWASMFLCKQLLTDPCQVSFISTKGFLIFQLSKFHTPFIMKSTLSVAHNGNPKVGKKYGLEDFIGLLEMVSESQCNMLTHPNLSALFLTDELCNLMPWDRQSLQAVVWTPHVSIEVQWSFFYRECANGSACILDGPEIYKELIQLIPETDSGPNNVACDSKIVCTHRIPSPNRFTYPVSETWNWLKPLTIGFDYVCTRKKPAGRRYWNGSKWY